MVVHTFNFSTQEGEAGKSLGFKASLIYTESSRPVSATQWYIVSRKTKPLNFGGQGRWLSG